MRSSAISMTRQRSVSGRWTRSIRETRSRSSSISVVSRLQCRSSRRSVDMQCLTYTAVWQWQPESVQTVKLHRFVRIHLHTLHMLRVHYCVLFSSRVKVRVRVMIRFSAWLVSCYAHVFLPCSIVTVTVPRSTGSGWLKTGANAEFYINRCKSYY